MIKIIAQLVVEASISKDNNFKEARSLQSTHMIEALSILSEEDVFYILDRCKNEAYDINNRFNKDIRVHEGNSILTNLFKNETKGNTDI